jgi:hypothetical protein
LQLAVALLQLLRLQPGQPTLAKRWVHVQSDQFLIPRPGAPADGASLGLQPPCKELLDRQLLVGELVALLVSRQCPGERSCHLLAGSAVQVLAVRLPSRSPNRARRPSGRLAAGRWSLHRGRGDARSRQGLSAEPLDVLDHGGYRDASAGADVDRLDHPGAQQLIELAAADPQRRGRLLGDGQLSDAKQRSQVTVMAPSSVAVV